MKPCPSSASKLRRNAGEWLIAQGIALVIDEEPTTVRTKASKLWICKVAELISRDDTPPTPIGGNMLPDYPEFKKECEKIVREKLDQVRDDCVAPFGPKSEAANHFEGRMFEIIRADGSGEPETYSQVEEKFFFKNGELEKLTLEQLLDKYSEVGESMGRQQFGIMMNAINNAIQGGPNEIIASQEDLIEQIFTSLETIHLDFDDDGQPSKLQIIAAPGMAKRLREASEEIENTPKLKKRHEELLNKKREEFRDREATRKLVD